MALNLYKSQCCKKLKQDSAVEAQILSIILSSSFELTYTCKTQIKFLNNQVHVDTATLDALRYLQMEKKRKKYVYQTGRRGGAGLQREEHLKELASIYITFNTHGARTEEESLNVKHKQFFPETKSQNLRCL